MEQSPRTWWKASGWTLGLCILMTAANLGLFSCGPQPSACWLEYLQFDRQRILQGQVWRIVAGNLVHWSTEHFLLDVGAFLLVGLLYERQLARWYPWILYFSALAVGCGVLIFRPDVEIYRGLSGVDSGQFAAALMIEIDAACHQLRRLTWMLPVTAVFVFKILYECLSGRMFFGTESLGNIGLPVPIAHATGAAAAVVFSVLRWPGQSERRSRLVCREPAVG